MKHTHTYTELPRREGFWNDRDNDYPLLPEVKPGKPWVGREAFLIALARAETQAESNHYKGWSNCRICECKNGSADYELHGWCWPCGYYHYVQAHNVRPSLAFQEFVLGHHVGEE